MLQDSYIIAPLVWCIGYNAKIKRWNVVFVVDPSSVYLACLAGRNEYQKVEAQLGTAVERAKYDIYAVLAQNGSDLTWGSPTPKGPIKLETFSKRMCNRFACW